MGSWGSSILSSSAPKVDLPSRKCGLGGRREAPPIGGTRRNLASATRSGGQDEKWWHLVPPGKTALWLEAGGREPCVLRLQQPGVEFLPRWSWGGWREGTGPGSYPIDSCRSYRAFVDFLEQMFPYLLHALRVISRLKKFKKIFQQLHLRVVILLCQKWNSGLGLRSFYKEKLIPHQWFGYPKYSSYKEGRLNVQVLCNIVSKQTKLESSNRCLTLPPLSQAKSKLHDIICVTRLNYT